MSAQDDAVTQSNDEEPPSFFDRTPTISQRLQGGPPAGGKGRVSGFRGERVGRLQEEGPEAGMENSFGGQEDEEEEPAFNRTFSLTGKGGQPRPRRRGVRGRQPIREEVIEEGQDWEPDENPPLGAAGEEEPEMDAEEFFSRTMTLGNKPRFQPNPAAAAAALRDRVPPGSGVKARAVQAKDRAVPGAGRSMTLGERKQEKQSNGLEGPGTAFKKASSLAPGIRPRADGLSAEDSEQGDERQLLLRDAMGDAGESYDGPRSRRDLERAGYPMLPLPGEPQVVQCQKCGQLLEVPLVLPKAKKGVQKLRCGTCLRVSRFCISPLDPRGGAMASLDGAQGDDALATQDEMSEHIHGLGGASLDEQQEQEFEGEHEQGLQGSYDGDEGAPGMEGGESQDGVGGSPEASGQEGMFEDEAAGPQGHLPPSHSDTGPASTDEAEPCFERGVVVNGEPVADHVVRIAEKRAGPIHPGDYWYDEIAGFWGAMGGPCLGIVPPGIEFGHALPRECAGGTTGVVVNGRELHRKDLERLKKRGLPEEPDSVYRIEITGNVFDWESGEFLMGLGKLAPSLETRKRGGGMKMPESS